MLFDYCPKCRQATMACRAGKEHLCTACGFVFFQNTATAAGLIIEWDGRLLFTVRLHEPAKGGLGLPGGFVDNGESAEAGLCREVSEELGVAVPAEALRYLGSFPNRYPFKGVLYHTVDLFFSWQPDREPAAEARDEVAAVRWIRRAEIPLAELAFPSARQALARYLR